MQAYREYRHGATVGVVSGVFDPLVVETQVGPRTHGDVIVGFDDLFSPRMRQPAIADENAETARIQVPFACGGDPVIDGRDAEVSSGRCQRTPLIEAPTATERSISVNS
jgi:hypothetical protein